ncbi:hypothetical protein EVAR_6514_1 [Eumeta japonica]|uniref:Uncharacterized protein n=1 Tax=Eumeta variegata TaxID=151549 RepID=A0A4C1SQ73_EUMVA|nr:hypothetical protein EVAR_6514_1 [Eumeta japonica]
MVEMSPSHPQPENIAEALTPRHTRRFHKGAPEKNPRVTSHDGARRPPEDAARAVIHQRPSIRDLEQKFKAALSELKASREMCDYLVGERDNHETEIRSVVSTNT